MKQEHFFPINSSPSPWDGLHWATLGHGLTPEPVVVTWGIESSSCQAWDRCPLLSRKMGKDNERDYRTNKQKPDISRCLPFEEIQVSHQ